MTPDQDLSARLDAMHYPYYMHAIADAYRSGQLITLADHERAVANAVEAERKLLNAADWENPDHITITHMLGMSAAELSVDLCRIGLFPAVGVDDGGEFVLGPFTDADRVHIDGSAGVHWSAEEKHYYWSAYIKIYGTTISGHWPIDIIPDELISVIESRKNKKISK